MLKKARPLLVAACLVSVPLFAQTDEIEVDFVNGVYTDLDSAIQPVERGGLTIHVSSPEHRLTVHRNRLRLTANGDGTVDATLEVEFEGEGDIVARIEDTGSSFEDRVAAPRQSVSVSGRARLEPIAEGYLMTVVDGPASVDLEIESELAGRLVGLCRTLEKLPVIPVDCSGIETALSVVTAPLPGPGEQFVVQADDLTRDERAFFDRFARRR